MNTASQKHVQDSLQPLPLQPDRSPCHHQAYAGKHGLSTCLHQNAETVYANIEKELLAIICTCQHFCMYLFSCFFTVETEHKPLEMIILKNLTAIPLHLQWMLLCLQQYDAIVRYRPGSKVQLWISYAAFQYPAVRWNSPQSACWSHCLQ